MAGIEGDPAASVRAGVAGAGAGQGVDLTAAAGVPPEIVAGSLADYMRGWWQRVRSGDSGVLPVLLGIVVITIYFQISNSLFLSPLNLVNLLEQSSIYMLLAMAEIFALLLGEIDLSVGLVMGMGAVIVAALVQPSGLEGLAWPWWLAIIVTLLICSGIGAAQGTLVARFKMPSFIVTLGGALVLQGAAIIVLHGGALYIGSTRYTNQRVLYEIFSGAFSPLVSWILLGVVVVAAASLLWFRDTSRRRRGLVAPPPALTAAKILLIAAAGILVVAICNINRAHAGVIEGVPFLLVIVLVIFLAWTLLLQRTRYGRYVYAIGGNPEAARRAGISLVNIRTWGFVLAGLTAGIAGILFASWQVNLTTNVIKAANQYVLLAVAAAVIGGTSLFGGRGKTLHGVLGGLVIGGIYNGLYLLGVESQWVSVAVGVVLLAAGVIDVLSRRGALGRT